MRVRRARITAGASTKPTSPTRSSDATSQSMVRLPADIADAEAAIARLNVEATSLVDTEALARILLRAESVASSRIEGLEIGAQRLLRAEAARVLGDDPSDVTAVEVLGTSMPWSTVSAQSAPVIPSRWKYFLKSIGDSCPARD